MNKETKKFLRDFLKYRKMQTQLIKLRKKKADPKNVKPVTDLLQKINWHLADMDKAAELLLNPKTEVSNG